MSIAYEVRLTQDALTDLQAIHQYVAENGGPIVAEQLMAGLRGCCARLSFSPERGNVPKELLRWERRDIREAHYKPYRIFYRITETQVVIYAIADGRRDIATFLRQRALR